MVLNWSKYTVLIAEDDPINFRYVQLLLEKRTGVQVIWAKLGSEAIEKITRIPEVDLVLLDFQLPDVTGLEVLKQSKVLRPHLPVIMQTAKTWNNEEEECVEAGCNGFFTKPLDVDQLFEFMHDCIIKYSKKKADISESIN